MLEVILIRHGETDANRSLRFQGHADIPLNATGLLQSDRLARAFRNNGILERVAASYSSDLQRAVQTAQTSLQQTPHAAPVLQSALREQSFGVLEGLTFDEARASYPNDVESWMQFNADYALPSGESTRQFHDRVLGALNDIALAHRSTPENSCVLVFSNGGVVDMAWRHLTGQPLSGPRTCEIPNVGLNHMRWDGRRFHLQDWADARHVADLPEQPRYDQRKLRGRN